MWKKELDGWSSHKFISRRKQCLSDVVCHHLLNEGLGSDAKRNSSQLLILSSLGHEAFQGWIHHSQTPPYPDQAQLALSLASLQLAPTCRNSKLKNFPLTFSDEDPDVGISGFSELLLVVRKEARSHLSTRWLSFRRRHLPINHPFYSRRPGRRPAPPFLTGLEVIGCF